MKALVVYESTYGNTEKVARAVGDALTSYATVAVKSVEDVTAGDVRGVGLLVVGGPTQRRGVSPRLHQWLDSLAPRSLRGVIAVAFDTRYRLPSLISGSAAHGIVKRLHRLGAEVFLPVESFYVEGREGPLVEGELERAARWVCLARVRTESTAK